MSKNYFLNNFPIVSYNGFNAVNILARAAFVKSLKSNATNFFHYKIQDGMRADQIANDVYGDSSYDWLIYMINNIVDSYYDWPLSENNFDAMITKRYGSIQAASQLILYWASNWYDDETVLTPAGYAALTQDVKKYFSPVLLPGNQVHEYRRAQMDIVRTTNMIVSLKFNSAPSTPYVIGDYVSQVSTPAAKGQVCWASNTTINIQHVFGTWTDGVAYNIQNQKLVTSNATSNTFQVVIPTGELVYYEAVDAYTDEKTVNNSKSFILLLRKELLSSTETAFAKAMAGAPNL